MRHIPTTAIILAFALTAITVAITAPKPRHSMTIERTTNKWDSPAMPSPCELDPTLQGCGELVMYPLPDVCQLDPTLQGCEAVPYL